MPQATPSNSGMRSRDESTTPLPNNCLKIRSPQARQHLQNPDRNRVLLTVAPLQRSRKNAAPSLVRLHKSRKKPNTVILSADFARRIPLSFLIWTPTDSSLRSE